MGGGGGDSAPLEISKTTGPILIGQKAFHSSHADLSDPLKKIGKSEAEGVGGQKCFENDVSYVIIRNAITSLFFRAV